MHQKTLYADSRIALGSAVAKHTFRFYVEATSDEPDSHELARRIAVLEERMKTQQAKYDSALDRFRADMARRGKDNTRWQIGLWIAAAVVLGFLIRWPF